MLRTIDTPYTYKRDGIFYYSRRVPKDLFEHYIRTKFILKSKGEKLRPN